MKTFDPTAHALSINRRSFLTQSAYGLGGLALAMMQNRALAAAGGPARPAHWHGALKAAHLPVKAKRVIFLCMAGGPSQFETFDWKPVLKDLHDQPFPESFTKGQQLAHMPESRRRSTLDGTSEPWNDKWQASKASK